MIPNSNFVIFEIGVVAIAGFVSSFLLTSALLKLARAHGLLDVPNQRSSHKVPTPRGGGLALVISSAITCCALAAVHIVSRDVAVALLGGGIAVAAIGFVDDRKSVSPVLRLTVHFASALWALRWLGGFPALSLGGKTLTFGSGGYVLGALGIVWFLNLFNFMDGIDGIAASEAIFITWGSVVISAFTASLGGVSAVAVAIGAATCGFLLWNAPPAKIFMGDVGSNFLGFSIAVLALAGTHETPNAMWTWLVLGGVFYVDATITLLRRLLRGERVYLAHRSHAYQWLARRWGAHGRVTVSVMVMNVAWLLPCAIWAAAYVERSLWIAGIALVPVVVIALAAGSGRREDTEHPGSLAFAVPGASSPDAATIGIGIAEDPGFLRSLARLFERRGPQVSRTGPAFWPSVLLWILKLPRPAKRLIMVAADSAMLPIVFWIALALQFDGLIAAWPYRDVLLGTALCGVPLFSMLGLYRAIVRFMSIRAIGKIFLGITLSVVTVGLCQHLGMSRSVPPSTLAIYWALCLLYVGGSRIAIRYACYYATKARTATRVAIYGAGEAGARLCSVLIGGGDFEPVLFVDDSAALHGTVINGIRVHTPQDLPRLLTTRRIDGVLLAMPSASHRRRREVLRALEPLGVHVQLLPDLTDIISGKARIDELREVDVCDLLGRDPVPPNPTLLESCIRGKSVMVTGAGGSIGSELCRQIVRVGPRRLVLFEMSELALYNAQRELEETSAREQLCVEIVPLLGSAQHRERLREVLTAYGIQTVYHAAAYKHVPIVEHNVVKGIGNNVICTWDAAEAALEAGVKTFVLISSDKAVNPTSVMGATKRLAELVLQGLQERSQTTRFCMVRFGNVLGSSGSVVPLFREQIRRGGPVTVTHPQMFRYFMTIPEAAQLVIQAGSMAKGGDVFVLDMGRPVRIDDLARRMVNLMGLTVRDVAHPDGDIEIVYTGLRSAEKLFEELLIGNNVTATEHPMILRAIEHSIPWPRMQRLLEVLAVALERFECDQALALLSEAVTEYRPSAETLDYVWARKQPAQLSDAKVADLIAKPRQTEQDGGVAPAVHLHEPLPLANTSA